MSERDYDALEAAERADMAIDQMQDELTRLRAIEAAAREVVDAYDAVTAVDEYLGSVEIEALRRALATAPP